MTRILDQTKSNDTRSDRVPKAIQEALGRPSRTSAECRHVPPSNFHPGQPLEIEFSSEKTPTSVRLYYRHVNQAERYQSVEMQSQGDRFRATIPALYTDSAYPIEYYFEMKSAPETACLYPGFDAERANQPYFVVRRPPQ
jgi:hypothetical protein